MQTVLNKRKCLYFRYISISTCSWYWPSLILWFTSSFSMLHARMGLGMRLHVAGTSHRILIKRASSFRGVFTDTCRFQHTHARMHTTNHQRLPVAYAYMYKQSVETISSFKTHGSCIATNLHGSELLPCPRIQLC